MKRILIIIPNKRRYMTLIFITVTLLLFLAIVIKTVFFSNIPVFGSLEEENIPALEKENDRLKGVLHHIVPFNSGIIYEDQYRNRYAYSHGYTPASLEIFQIQKVLKDGADIKFNLKTNEPAYLRTLYNPEWKDAYFRGWLNIPEKNIIARHRLFVYPFGGSSNFDFGGTMSFDSSGEFAVEASTAAAYQNLDLLVYAFSVKDIKYYKNQLILIGEPMRKGLQNISIDRFILIPDKVTKDILIQLVTPGGFEIDYIHETVFIPEYLKKNASEVPEKPVTAELNILDGLMDENLRLQKELSYFAPVKEEKITQEKCKPVPPNFPLDPELKEVRQKGQEIPININYRNLKYRRPVYDPLWLEHYKERWCYVPKQICYNLHRLFIIPQNQKERTDLFGILGFQENVTPIRKDESNLLLYNFKTDKAVIYEDQLLFTGTPSRTGVEVITLTNSNIPWDKISIIRMVTPDDQELDYAIP